jgi:hypothetical protein
VRRAQAKEQEEKRNEDKENTEIEIIFLIHAFKFSSSTIVQSISWKSSLSRNARLEVGLIFLDVKCKAPERNKRAKSWKFPKTETSKVKQKSSK